MPKTHTHIGKLNNYLAPVFWPLENSDIPLNRFISNNPLRYFDLTDPEIYIPVVPLYDLLYKMDRYVGKGKLTSLLYNNFKVEDLGKYGAQILTNPNMLHLWQEAIKYQHYQMTNLKMSIHIMGPISRLDTVFLDPPAEGRGILYAVSINSIIGVFKHFGGENWTPLEVHVPGDQISYFKHLLPKGDFPVYYCSEGHSIYFPTEMLGALNPSLTDKSVFLGLNSNHKNLSHRIENLMNSYRPGLKISLSDFREYFNLSERSIKRYLRAEGTSFIEIKKRVTLLKAIDLVSKTNWPINEIAVHLGYNETSNFVRFFRQCTGISPSLYRAAGDSPHF